MTMPLADSSLRQRQKVYSSDGAIAVKAHTAILSKGSAGAYTLAAPNKDGITLKILVGSNFPHVVTFPSNTLVGFDNFGQAPDTGSVLTFYTQPLGSVVNLVSFDGKWYMGSDGHIASATLT